METRTSPLTSAEPTEEDTHGWGSLGRATLTVMGGYAASRLLGLARNVVIGYLYGASREYEAFVAALAVPDAVFQILAGGAVASAFIPVFTRYLARQRGGEAWRLASSLMNLSALVTGAASLALAVMAEPLMALLAPGWDPATRETAAGLARIMLVTPALFAVSCFATSSLQSLHRFTLAATAPALYNLAVILGALLLRPFGIYGVAVGVAAGAVLHLGVQVPGLARAGMAWSATLNLRDQGVRDVLRLVFPRMMGLGVGQLNQLAAVFLASFSRPGSLAFLNYAWLVAMLPIGLFAMSVSTAAFPTLAREGALGSRGSLGRLFTQTLSGILFLVLPASLGLVLLGEPVVGLLFQRGRFDAEATQATAYALGFYSLGLVGHAATEIAGRVFYAMEDTRTPVAASALGVLTGVGAGALLMRTPLSFGGLALGASLGALLEAGLLLALLWRKVVEPAGAGLLKDLARMAVAAVAMGLAVQGMALAAGPALGHPEGTLSAAYLGGTVVVAAVIYGGLGLFLGCRPARQWLNVLRGHR